MTAEIIKLDLAHTETAFSRCREVVRAGGVLAYPTDTFYGLGVDPHDPRAIQRLFVVKGRQADQPILLLLADAGAVKDWVAAVTPQAERLMQRFWPGPLTLVFTAKAGVPAELTAGTGTIGLRVPGSAITRQLLAFLGTALTGTSANRSGAQSPATAVQVVESLGTGVDLVLDSGSTAGNRPSTVVDVRNESPTVIREGAILARDIAAQALNSFTKAVP